MIMGCILMMLNDDAKSCTLALTILAHVATRTLTDEVQRIGCVDLAFAIIQTRITAADSHVFKQQQRQFHTCKTIPVVYAEPRSVKIETYNIV